LQTDRTVRKIADYISRKVGDRLKELYRDRREEYIVFGKMSAPLSNSALSTTKFKKVEDIIIYRTTYEAGTREKPIETPAVQVQSQEGDAWQDVTPSQNPTPDSPRSTSQYTLKGI